MFNKMPLSVRLAGGFLLVTLLFCIVALVGILKISAVSNEVDLTIRRGGADPGCGGAHSRGNLQEDPASPLQISATGETRRCTQIAHNGR
jgi:hypothetical protein